MKKEKDPQIFIDHISESIEAKKIVKKYAEVLKDNKFAFSAIYLFGSHAKNSANRWSDIDVAVVTDRLNRNNDTVRWGRLLIYVCQFLLCPTRKKQK